MAINAVTITATDRMVWRVKATRAAGRPSFRYFTTPGAAVKFAAWEIIAARHLIYDPGYTVHGTACECHDPESGPGYYSAGWEDCPLHDHRTGFYARLHARIAARLRRQMEPAPASPHDAARQALGKLGDAMELLNGTELDANLTEFAAQLTQTIGLLKWAIQQAERPTGEERQPTGRDAAIAAIEAALDHLRNAPFTYENGVTHNGLDEGAVRGREAHERLTDQLEHARKGLA